MTPIQRTILASLAFTQTALFASERPVIFVNEIANSTIVDKYAKDYRTFTEIFKNQRGEDCPEKLKMVRPIFQSALNAYPRSALMERFPTMLAIGCKEDLVVTNSHQGVVFVGVKDIAAHSEDFLRFVITHEIAHIALLHTGREYRGLPPLTVAESESEIPYLNQEEDADAVAFCLSIRSGVPKVQIMKNFDAFFRNFPVANRFDRLQKEFRPRSLRATRCP